MNLTEAVKQLARDQQMDFVSIAPVERFAGAPKGHNPADLLDDARSVVTIGMRLSEGVRRANIKAHSTGAREPLWTYMWFGYGQINLHFLDRTSHLITRLIEREGEVAMPTVASGVEDLIKYEGGLSHRHAAVAAGVGEFGWNTLCVTNENGPRARFSSIITTAELEPDPLYGGPPICDVEKCRSYCLEKYGVAKPVCVHVCPVQAISENDGPSLMIGDRKYTYARVNRWRCVWASSTLHEEDGILKPLPPPDIINGQVLAKARESLSPSYLMEWMVIGRGHRCGQCITLCPSMELRNR